MTLLCSLSAYYEIVVTVLGDSQILWIENVIVSVI